MTASEDASLISRLAAIAARVDPVPAQAHQLGRDLFALHNLDDELATLVADSAVDAQLTRAATTGVRLLSFESTDLAIELQCARSVLLGQLLPEAPGQVQLQTVAGLTVTAVADEDGRFSFPDPPETLARFVVGRVATPWLRL